MLCCFTSVVCSLSKYLVDLSILLALVDHLNNTELSPKLVSLWKVFHWGEMWADFHLNRITLTTWWGLIRKRQHLMWKARWDTTAVIQVRNKGRLSWGAGRGRKKNIYKLTGFEKWLGLGMRKGQSQGPRILGSWGGSGLCTETIGGEREKPWWGEFGRWEDGDLRMQLGKC